MTEQKSGAFSTWKNIDWKVIEKQVYILQVRIAKAIKEKHYGKTKSLQWLLTHSYYAKLLAVKRVTENKGRKTPGIDNEIWSSSKQKLEAVLELNRRGYKAKPLRRIYIPKSNNGKRPLGIPTMKDRAQQALYLLALEPVSETLADNDAYGFRPKRCTADAIEQCHLCLSKKGSAKWVLEADIKSCFDNISHEWLLKNIPTDKYILKQWLKAGYIESKALFPTHNGTPQGGIISPALLVITLSGLAKAVADATNKQKDKCHVVAYADDFLVTGSTKEVLTNKVQPAIEDFLKKRGLCLSIKKTKITHITEGYDFLGFNVRKYPNGKVLTKPSKESIKRIKSKIRSIIKSNPAVSTEKLIRLLNPVIRGWSNYFRWSCSKNIFYRLDHYIFKTLWHWIHRRHSRKSATWRKNKYFREEIMKNWIFFTKIKTKHEIKFLDLFKAGTTPVRS